MPVSFVLLSRLERSTDAVLHSLAGTCLKKKQIWTITYSSRTDCVYLQSPLNNYLSTDRYGRLRCDNLDLDDDCRFHLDYNPTGQWALKSFTYGMYLGGDNDQLHCFSKTPQWWSPHLALRPQVSFFSSPPTDRSNHWA